MIERLLRSCQRIPFKLEIFATLTMLAVFLPISHMRLIARDEGFYLMGANMVAAGRIPYLDFFFPQTPLTAYFYGVIFKIFGPGWEIARAANALLATLTGLLVVRFLRRENRAAALLAVLLIISSNFAFSWWTVSNTYPLSIFLLTGSYFLSRDKQRYGPLAAGLCFGLSVLARLTFAPLGVVFIVLYYLRNRRNWIKETLWFCLGTGLALSPLLLFIIQDWQSFYFNNFGYHLTRAGTDEGEDPANRLRILGVIFGYLNSVKFSAWQLPLLVWVLLAVSVRRFFKHREIVPELLMCACLTAVCFIPNPTYVQYFAALVPFLVIIAATALVAGLNSKKIHFVLLSCALILIYIWGVNKDIDNYTRTGEGVIGIMTQANARRWNLAEIESTREQIDRLVPADSQLFSFWPGYLIGSKIMPFPGTENHFGFPAASRLPKNEADKYKIISYKSAAALFEAAVPDFVLISRNETKMQKNNKVLQAAGYQLIYQNFFLNLYASNSNRRRTGGL